MACSGRSILAASLAVAFPETKGLFALVIASIGASNLSVRRPGSRSSLRRRAASPRLQADDHGRALPQPVPPVGRGLVALGDRAYACAVGAGPRGSSRGPSFQRQHADLRRAHLRRRRPRRAPPARVPGGGAEACTWNADVLDARALAAAQLVALVVAFALTSPSAATSASRGSTPLSPSPPSSATASGRAAAPAGGVVAAAVEAYCVAHLPPPRSSDATAAAPAAPPPPRRKAEGRASALAEPSRRVSIAALSYAPRARPSSPGLRRRAPGHPHRGRR